MKVAIYTCNIGDHETYKPLMVKNDDCDYYYVTDKPVNIDGFKTIVVSSSILDYGNDKAARYVKTHPYEFFDGYDYCVYIDASFDIHMRNIHDLILSFGEFDIVQFAHPNTCLYKEMDVCISNGMSNKEMVELQRTKYKSECFPEEYGLLCGGFIISKNSHKVIDFFNNWWDEIITYTHRDQLSEMYCLWKNKINFKKINDNIYGNKHITHIQYKRIVFLDCGAWQGCSVDEARKLFNNTVVFSFEPNENNIKYLEEKNVAVLPYIVCGEDGEKPFYFGLSESSSIYKNKKTGNVDPDNYKVYKSINLAKWIKKHLSKETYIILKLNIEGAEYDVLRSMEKEGILDWVDKWYIQWHWNKIDLPQKEHDRLSSLIKWRQWNVM
jgi:FkbM family methyltransferase